MTSTTSTDHDHEDYAILDESGYTRVWLCAKCGECLQVGGRSRLPLHVEPLLLDVDGIERPAVRLTVTEFEDVELGGGEHILQAQKSARTDILLDRVPQLIADLEGLLARAHARAT
jgi:hypothetical protein